MGDVLSQSEVESLLSALEPSGGSAPVTVSSNSSRRAEGTSLISVYDFKRPERVSKEQMRAFQALHEGFSREFGASLSGMLRAIVEVKLISVDQLTYSEFVFSLENPTVFNLLESEGLQGQMILDLNPSIVFPIVDRLLGGGKESTMDIPSRALTEIEQQLVSRITDLAIMSLENSWANVASLKLRVSQVESNPQLVQIVPPNEVVVLISFELMMGEIRGIMNLCIPFNTIEPLSGVLTSDNWSAYQKKTVDTKLTANLETSLELATLNLSVQLARTTLTAGDLALLQLGDVIITESGINDGVEVIIEGLPMYKAKPGLMKGHKAIQLGKPIRSIREVIEGKLSRLAMLEAKTDASAKAA